MPIQFYGIITYEILNNGNMLNGVYTNTGLKQRGQFHMDNEIAIKTLPDHKGAVGDYDCRYIETVSGASHAIACTLKISNNNGVYELTWFDNNANKVIFKGIGLVTGNGSHMAVSYVNG